MFIQTSLAILVGR